MGNTIYLYPIFWHKKVKINYRQIYTEFSWDQNQGVALPTNVDHVMDTEIYFYDSAIITPGYHNCYKMLNYRISGWDEHGDYYASNRNENPPYKSGDRITSNIWANKSTISTYTEEDDSKDDYGVTYYVLNLWCYYSQRSDLPTINPIYIGRSKSDGTIDDEGSYARINYSWNSLSTHNTIEIDIYNKSISQNSLKHISHTTNTGENNGEYNDIVTDLTLNYAFSYDIKIRIRDIYDNGEVGEVIFNYTIDGVNVIFDIMKEGKGIAFGMGAVTEDLMDVAYNANFRKQVLLNGINLLDIFYPIGSYYETSDTNFNPNTTWGGTWVQDSAGKVTVGLDSNDSDFNTIGNVSKGSKDNTLTINNLPSHTHNYDKSAASTQNFTLKADHIPAHTHGEKSPSGYACFRRYGTATPGTNLAGLEVGGIVSHTEGTWSGSHSLINIGGKNYTNTKWDKITITAKHTHDSVGGGKPHSHGITLTSTATSSAGSSTPNAINNIQPSIVVVRWHRTA